MAQSTITPIQVYVYELPFALGDLLHCHRERATHSQQYMAWCRCASGGTLHRLGSTGFYGDEPWHNDIRGAVAAEIWMYSGLVNGALASLGVHQTQNAAKADLFFIPVFSVLSWTLSEAYDESGLGRCSSSHESHDWTFSHEDRMIGALEAVESHDAFARSPHRHFVFGAAEFGGSIANFGDGHHHRSHNLKATYPPTMRMMNFTRRLTAVNVERAWEMTRLFRTVVIAPYAVTDDLTTAKAQARVAATGSAERADELGMLRPVESSNDDDHTPSHSAAQLAPLGPDKRQRPLLLYFRGSNFVKSWSSRHSGEQTRHLLLTSLLAHLRNESRSTGLVAPQHPDVVLEYGGEYRRSSTYGQSMLSSVFCLVPPGHTCTTRRYFDAIAAGCIPVRTGCFDRADSVVFPHFLNHSAFTLAVPSAAITRHPAAFFSLLRACLADHSRMAEIRRHLDDARQRILYVVGTEASTSQLTPASQAHQGPVGGSSKPASQGAKVPRWDANPQPNLAVATDSYHLRHKTLSPPGLLNDEDGAPLKLGGALRSILEELLLLDA